MGCFYLIDLLTLNVKIIDTSVDYKIYLIISLIAILLCYTFQGINKALIYYEHNFNSIFFYYNIIISLKTLNYSFFIKLCDYLNIYLTGLSY